MAKIEATNPALIPENVGDSSTQVTFDGNIYIKSYTLTHTRRRRPFWVVDLYAVRNTMRVAEPDEP